MVLSVRSEDGECLAVDVGVPQPSGLDDGAYVLGFGLQLALQDARGAPLGDLGKTLACVPIVRPNSENKMGLSVKDLWPFDCILCFLLLSALNFSCGFLNGLLEIPTRACLCEMGNNNKKGVQMLSLQFHLLS